MIIKTIIPVYIIHLAMEHQWKCEDEFCINNVPRWIKTRIYCIQCDSSIQITRYHDGNGFVGHNGLYKPLIPHNNELRGIIEIDCADEQIQQVLKS